MDDERIINARKKYSQLINKSKCTFRLILSIVLRTFDFALSLSGRQPLNLLCIHLCDTFGFLNQHGC